MPEKMSPEEAQRRYQRASVLFQGGKYQKALAELNEVARFYRNPQVLKAQQACWEKLSPAQAPAARIDDILGVPRSPARTTSEPKKPSRRRWLFPVVGASVVMLGIAAFFVVSGGKERSKSVASQAAQAPPSALNSVLEDNSRPAVSSPVPDDFDVNAPFDLDKEVKRALSEVESGSNVPDFFAPQWKRESYQPIIDAAREARLKIENPYTDGVTHAEKFPTDVVTLSGVPPNITGKTTFRMRYISDGRYASKADTLWGDNEDIVYITGVTTLRDLRILPGTIVLFTSFSNDATQQGQQGLGALTVEEIRVLGNAYRQAPGFTQRDATVIGIQSLLHQPPYAMDTTPFASHFARIHVVDYMAARGTNDRPILFCSDAGGDSGLPFLSSPTPYNYASSFSCPRGIIEYSISLDCEVSSAPGNDTLTYRCLFDNHLGSGRNGPGWVVANFFGNAHNEGIDIHMPGDFRILWNSFDNDWGSGITIAYPATIRIEHNTFQGKMGIVIIEEYARDSSLLIRENNILANNGSVVTSSPANVNMQTNYWGTTVLTEIEGRIGWVTRTPLDYTHPLSSPVPMSFKTGIAEVDAAYKK